ncbi:MAG: hypothetical protein AMJ73_07755 [candidate division Zixibacteria bacterium SM1_73]|nr:MAG: hypothetical protein AMJ73_07755 [candidate division Zixibacteria bacterium SM1_73]
MHQEVLNVSQWPLLKTPFHYLHQKVKVGLKGWLRSYSLIRGYHFGMKGSTRIKDYHLKGCMLGQKCKPKISGTTLLRGLLEDLKLMFCGVRSHGIQKEVEEVRARFWLGS